MSDPFGNDHHNSWIPFTDLMASALSIFLVAAMLLVFYLVLANPNPKTKEGDIRSPGTVMVETFWKSDVDVDTWVKSPGDSPVGYSRKSGTYFDLLRDDLGMSFEIAAGMHHENVYSRNAPPGEYIINVHMYSLRGKEDALPVDVEIDVRIVMDRGDKTSASTKVIKTHVLLTHLNEEITVVRFRLDDKDNLITDSINHNQIPLRDAKS